MKNFSIAILFAAAAVSCVEAPTNESEQQVKVGFADIKRFVGTYSCAVHYFDAPPFTTAKLATADFVVTSNGYSTIFGNYQEVPPTVLPLHIDDQITVGTAVTGTRTFADSNGGMEVGTYTLIHGIGGALHFDFTGTYTIFGLGFPFTEALDLAADSNTFSFDAQIALSVQSPAVTFVHEECTRVGVEAVTDPGYTNTNFQTVCDSSEDGSCGMSATSVSPETVCGQPQQCSPWICTISGPILNCSPNIGIFGAQVCETACGTSQAQCPLVRPESKCNAQCPPSLEGTAWLLCQRDCWNFFQTSCQTGRNDL